jgi:hypothetical protein
MASLSERAADLEEVPVWPSGAYLMGMKELDATIGWLYEQTAYAQKALADLKGGHHNIEIRGRDKRKSWSTIASTVRPRR